MGCSDVEAVAAPEGVGGAGGGRAYQGGDAGCAVVTTLRRRRPLPTEERRRWGAQDFETVCLIGQGSAALVYLVRCRRTGKMSALKVSGLNLPILNCCYGCGAARPGWVAMPVGSILPGIFGIHSSNPQHLSEKYSPRPLHSFWVSIVCPLSDLVRNMYMCVGMFGMLLIPILQFQMLLKRFVCRRFDEGESSRARSPRCLNGQLESWPICTHPTGTLPSTMRPYSNSCTHHLTSERDSHDLLEFSRHFESTFQHQHTWCGPNNGDRPPLCCSKTSDSCLLVKFHVHILERDWNAPGNSQAPTPPLLP